MDFVNAFFPLLLTALLYILPVWLLWRAARALEKTADNLWTISRTNTRSVEAIEKVANRIERIADNENTRE
jgi:uncharacterized membrane protein YbhN (UPF0104 family)